MSNSYFRSQLKESIPNLSTPGFSSGNTLGRSLQTSRNMSGSINSSDIGLTKVNLDTSLNTRITSRGAFANYLNQKSSFARPSQVMNRIQDQDESQNSFSQLNNLNIPSGTEMPSFLQLSKTPQPVRRALNDKLLRNKLKSIQACEQEYQTFTDSNLEDEKHESINDDFQENSTQKNRVSSKYIRNKAQEKYPTKFKSSRIEDTTINTFKRKSILSVHGQNRLQLQESISRLDSKNGSSMSLSEPSQ